MPLISLKILLCKTPLQLANGAFCRNLIPSPMQNADKGYNAAMFNTTIMLIIISAIIEFLVSVIQIGVSCTNCMSSAVLPLCQIRGYCSLFDITIMLL